MYTRKAPLRGCGMQCFLSLSQGHSVLCSPQCALWHSLTSLHVPFLLSITPHTPHGVRSLVMHAPYHSQLDLSRPLGCALWTWHVVLERTGGMCGSQQCSLSRLLGPKGIPWRPGHLFHFVLTMIGFNALQALLTPWGVCEEYYLLGKAHEGMSRNAKRHIRAAKGTVSLGKRLESMLVDISGTAVSCSLNYEVSILWSCIMAIAVYQYKSMTFNVQW